MSLEPPAPVRLLELSLFASWRSDAIAVVAELGVADELADGPRHVDDIAEALDVHPPSLYRLLRAVAGYGVFDELDGRRFALNEMGELLRSDVPGSLRANVRYPLLPCDRVAWPALATTLRSGEPTFESVHGQTIFAYLRSHPDEARVFDDAMTGNSSHEVAPLVDAYDFGRFRTIVDVGGGNGALLAMILSANPEGHGILFDHPDVVAAAAPLLEQAGVEGRCELVGGDFFESVPAGGDAYLLSNIVHDWDDDRAAVILANCRAALGSTDGGRVLLAEQVLHDEDVPALTKLADLVMMVVTPGGRQRTEPEHRQLLHRAGLELTRIIIPGGDYSLVEAAPL